MFSTLVWFFSAMQTSARSCAQYLSICDVAPTRYMYDVRCITMTKSEDCCGEDFRSMLQSFAMLLFFFSLHATKMNS